MLADGPSYEELPTEVQRTVDSSRSDLLAAVKTIAAHSTTARLLFGISLPQAHKAQPVATERSASVSRGVPNG